MSHRTRGRLPLPERFAGPALPALREVSGEVSIVESESDAEVSAWWAARRSFKRGLAFGAVVSLALGLGMLLRLFLS